MADYNKITTSEKGEMVMIDHMKKKGLKYIGRVKGDLKLQLPECSRFMTFKVKTDIWNVPGKYLDMPFGRMWVEGRDSGKLFIEFKHNSSPSGIAVTESTGYQYYLPHFKEMWYIPTKKLIKLISDYDFREVTQKESSFSTRTGYLIPKEEFKKHFNVYKIDYEWQD